MATIGKTLCILAIGLLFLAYSNFAPTSLGSENLADYVKNHFVREVIFGVALGVIAIVAVLRAEKSSDLGQVALLGAIVILPFWVAALAGWSTGGLEEVWDGEIDPSAAYWLHGVQTAAFSLGLGCMALGLGHGGDAVGE